MGLEPEKSILFDLLGSGFLGNSSLITKWPPGWQHHLRHWFLPQPGILWWWSLLERKTWSGIPSNKKWGALKKNLEKAVIKWDPFWRGSHLMHKVVFSKFFLFFSRSLGKWSNLTTVIFFREDETINWCRYDKFEGFLLNRAWGLGWLGIFHDPCIPKFFQEPAWDRLGALDSLCWD